jgi:hypothetical protein
VHHTSTASNTTSAPSQSYAESIDSAAVRRLLGSFPTSAIAARNIDAKEFKDSIFVTNVRDGITYVTVPKNVESYMGNLLFISILKCFETRGWIITLSEKELPKAVLETKDGAFFAGFVAQSLQSTTGRLNDGATKFDKGARAHQIFSVETSHKNQTHLRTGGIDKVTKKLSEMKGFTQAYWGLRGTIASIFKTVKTNTVTDLGSYLKPKGELVKIMKTKFAYENGGVFRAEEITYLSSRYSQHKRALTELLARLDHPDDNLARDFPDLYANVRAGINASDNEIRPIEAARARVLFPSSKKKAAQRFAKKALTEKLIELTNEQKINMKPESLPGIVFGPAQTDAPVGTAHWLSAHYGDVDDTIQDVCFSWYSSFESSAEEQD